jgi:hypothetical protein
MGRAGLVPPGSQRHFTEQHAGTSAAHAGQLPQPAQPSAQHVAHAAPQQAAQSTAQSGQLAHPSAQPGQVLAQQVSAGAWAWAVPGVPADIQVMSPASATTTNARDLIAVMNRLRW